MTGSSSFPSVVRTGATGGIGEATARALASRATRLTFLGAEPEPAVAEVLGGIRAAGFTRLLMPAVSPSAVRQPR